MENLNAARALMGDSLAFHIILVMFGIGLPVVFSLLEFIAIKNKNSKLLESAKLLSYITGVLVVAGVVSGTLIAIQFSLMWPGLVEFGSKIIGLPFMFEGYAFILEALFLGFYLVTWNTIKGYKHWILSLPIILGSFLSAIFITMVNAWMNKPGGFDLVNGQMVNINIWQGLLTKTYFFMISHTMVSYLLTIFLTVAAGYAVYLIKNKKGSTTDKNNAKYIIRFMLILAFSFVVLIAIIGHFQTQYLADSQPRKFAAIELVPRTTSNAPYVIGGELSADGTAVEGGIKIPGMLSILAGNSTSKVVPGLNEFAKEDWPMLIVNKLFEIKMILVSVLFAVPLAYLIVSSKWPKKSESKIMLIALVVAAVCSFIIVELGWMVTELGRQPYAVNGYLKTSEAFATNPGILQWGYIFPVLFVFLTAASAMAVRFVIKNFNKDKKEK